MNERELLMLETVWSSVKEINAKLDRLLAERPPGQLPAATKEELFEQMLAQMEGRAGEEREGR